MTSTTATARPRFRTDLVAEPIQDGNQRFIDVFDPDSGRGFRFYEVEYAMACAMDGERDVAGLARWAREELGVEPKPGELTRVISTLGELGYLAGERTDVGELAAGVVAGRAPMAPSVEPLELGTAGATPQARDELPRAPELELGQAGGVSSPRIVVDDFGAGPDLSARDEFPAPPPAAAPVAELQRRTIPDAGLEHDGPTDLPRPVPLAAGDEDVSTDLSDHLAISASDVKEAVRASRVMQAVELPADIAATLAAAEAEQEARAAADRAAADKAAAEQAAAEQAAAQREAEARLAAEKAAAEKAAAEKAAAEKSAAEKSAAEAAERAAAERVAAEKAAAEKAALLAPADKAADKADKAAEKPTDKAADKKPTDKAAGTGTAKLPPKDKGTATTAVEPPEPRTSRALIFLLVLTILLAGAYLVWTQILKKSLPWEKAEPTTTAAPTAPTPPPAPPAPPPPPSATLAEAPGATTDVAAGRQGTLVEVVADGSAVAAGDMLARFQAPPALGKKLATSRKRLDVELPKAITELTAKRDAATAANKADAVKTWQERLDKQEQARKALEAEVAALTTQLDAFTVKAPLAGTVKTQVAKGAKVTKDEQVIASITAPTMLTGMITVPSGNSYQVGDSVQVVPQAADGVAAAFAIACKVGDVQGLVVTVVCPPGGPLAPGSTITLP